MKLRVLTAALLTMNVTVVEAKPKPRLLDGEDTVALTGATVIDGTGAPPRPDAVVAIRKDRIVFVGDRAGVRLGKKVKTVDLAGRWLVPGFIDTHVHIPGPDDREPFLAQVAAHGTTTVRESAGLQTELRELVAKGKVPGPRIVAAGLLIDGKDSYFNWAAKVETVEELRAEVRRQLEQKPDFIKLYVGLQPALVKAAIEEAHARGVRVMGHLGKTTWGEAAELGIDSLAHSAHWGLGRSVVPAAHQAELREFYVPNQAFRASLFRKWREVVDSKGPEVARLAELLHQRHVEVHPNLVLGEALFWGDDATVRARLDPSATGRHPYSSHWTTEEMAEAKRAFQVVLEIIRVFHEKGVLLTAGTDYMNPWMIPGLAYHRELELLVQAGIPAADVLRIATRNGAEGLGLLKETGTIETGKAADLVVLTADPLALISNTRKIERVFLRGREVPGVAKDKNATATPAYDFYQMSIQAMHCNVKVLINGSAKDELSLNAAHGGAVSAPLYQQDLKLNNTIVVQLAETDAETNLSLNVVGIGNERQIVATNETGNVLTLDLDAKQVAASKSKRFSGQFKASFRKAKPKPNIERVSEEEAKAFATSFAALLRSKDREKLAGMFLPLAEKSPQTKGRSPTELREMVFAELAQLLDDKVLLADTGPIEVKAMESESRATYELRSQGKGGLLQFHEKADRDKKPHNFMVVIEKSNGKIQLAEIGIQ